MIWGQHKIQLFLLPTNSISNTNVFILLALICRSKSKDWTILHFNYNKEYRKSNTIHYFNANPNKKIRNLYQKLSQKKYSNKPRVKDLAK